MFDRFRGVPLCGPITDLVWSDPDNEKDGWSASPRGVSQLFGCQQTREFVAKNELTFIVRSHELVMPVRASTTDLLVLHRPQCSSPISDKGYLWHHDNKVLTIFSAPNYCYRCGNQGGILLLDESCQPTPKSYPAAECQRLEGEKAKETERK